MATGRITLADVKASRIPVAANVPSVDPRVAYYVNEAVQRLLPRGNWVGTVARFRFCLADGYLTLPRQIQQVLGVVVCDHPIRIRSQWYEFIENAFGRWHEPDGCASHLLDRGLDCAFASVSVSGNQIKVYCDLAADVSAPILLQGTDSTGKRVRTNPSLDLLTYVDGEYVLPSLAGTLSTTLWGLGGLASVQKPMTKGAIRLSEYNPTLVTERPIAAYEPTETQPQYRRCLIPGLSNLGQCCNPETTTYFPCTDKVVEVLAKLAFIPVVADTDFVLIQSIPALRLMVQCLRKEESNLMEEASLWEARAIQVLNDELQDYVGDATLMNIRMPTADIGGGGVLNVL